MPRSLVRSDWSITSTLMRHSFACVCTVTEDYVTTVPDSVQNGWMEWQANIYDTSYYMCDARIILIAHVQKWQAPYIQRSISSVSMNHVSKRNSTTTMTSLLKRFPQKTMTFSEVH